MANWRQNILLKFSTDPKDFWTVDDAMKGTSIIGGTGSGKTSASGKAIAMKFLEQGWGGLVLCAKTDEAKQWIDYCAETGRSNDLVIISKNAVHTNGNHKGKTIVFNPLNYEMKRTGEGAGEVFNITNIFMNLHKIRNRVSQEEGGKKDDMFWDNALKRIITRTIELINLAGEELVYKNMIDLIYSAPTEHTPLDNALFDSFIQKVKYEDDYRTDFKGHFFTKCLAKAFNKIADNEGSKEFEIFESIYQYFTSSLPGMSEHTHNAVIESFMGVVEPFLSGILNTHFSGETNISPEEIFTDNRIIVLNLSVKEFLDAGVMAQSIFKLIFQQAVERRNVEKYPTPIFLWADEAQYFVTPYDQLFLTTARSSRTATVFLSQSMSNYYAVMGSGANTKAVVNSLMGNLSTKIFHSNSDAETNEYASKLIGRASTFLTGRSSSSSFLNFNDNIGESLTESYMPQVQPTEFTMLKSGGEGNDFIVESIIFVTGKTWSNGTNFLRTTFEQEFPTNAKEV